MVRLPVAKRKGNTSQLCATKGTVRRSTATSDIQEKRQKVLRCPQRAVTNQHEWHDLMILIRFPPTPIVLPPCLCSEHESDTSSQPVHRDFVLAGGGALRSELSGTAGDSHGNEFWIRRPRKTSCHNDMMFHLHLQSSSWGGLTESAHWHVHSHARP